MKHYALIAIEIQADSKELALELAKVTARILNNSYDNRAKVYEIGHYDGLKEVVDLNVEQINKLGL